MKATEQVYVTVDTHALLRVEAAKAHMTIGELIHVLIANWKIGQEK